MDEKEIEKFLFSNPAGFFDFFDKKGINFSSLKKINFPKLIIKKRFPELVKENGFQAAEHFFGFHIMLKEKSEIVFFL